MSDNTTINAGTGGDVIATNDVGGYKIQRINLVIGVEGTDGGNVSSSNPLPTTSNGTVFTFSSVNSTTAQLASSASFIGSIESIVNQQSCSILLVSDVSIQLTLNQFIDAGGTRLASQWVFNVVGGVPYSRSFPINGNYFQAIAQNTSVNTSTTLRLDVAYGTIPSATNLGNTPVAINEVGGNAVSSAIGVPSNIQSVAGVPVVGGVLPVVDSILVAAQSSDSPIFTVITGDPTGDFAGVNIIEQVVSDGSGLGFNVKVINPPKLDANNATVLSDAPSTIQLGGAVGSNLVIDTTGYQSLNISTQGMAANVQASNDGITWTTLTGNPLAIGSQVTAVAANTGYSFPCIARYIRFVVTTAGTATAYLRAQPWTASYTTTGFAVNTTQISGTSIVTGGVAGIQAIGGNIAAGVAATANPVPVGGVDSSGLTRRLLTDATGRLAVAASATAGSFYNQTAALTTDVTQFEGATQIELLTQMLLEMRIMNQQLYELPNLLNSAISYSPDPPEAFRADPTVFQQ